MVTIRGKGVGGGIAFGTIQFYARGELHVKRTHVEDTAGELARFQRAKEGTLEQLRALYQKAVREVGEANAQIFDIHQMMVEDLDYNESIQQIITSQQVNAEYAVAVTSDNFALTFSSMEDDYMRERASDVRDVSNRLIAQLLDKREDAAYHRDSAIVCADDLAPSETVQLDKTKVAAFVTSYGSSNSHTAILARTMNIPAVIGAGEALLHEYDGREAIVDGYAGCVYIDPDEQTRADMEARAAEETKKRELLLALKGKENRTVDGQVIDVFANIGGLGDVGPALANDAGGVGLFRSEFLYLENSDYPTEEQQFQTYKTVVERMAGRRVIIRTLDIGADKQIDYFGLEREDNPALGYRAIRICLTRPELFKTQLRALYRASAYGNLAILFPMITSVEEVEEVLALCREVREELGAAGAPFREDVELGIMLETPAAVLISDRLAQMVDFFSVGTNDLTQYTLAVDRQNPKLDRFYQPHHQGLLRLIKLAADNAHRHGKWIGVCGELGADPALTEVFLAMEIDELSVSPSAILPLRSAIRGTNLEGRRQQILEPYGL